MDAGEALDRASEELVARVRLVGPAAWTSPTPCPGLDIRGLVGHVVAGNVFAARLLEGASAERALAGLDRDLLGDDPATVAEATCARQRAAFLAVGDLDDVQVDHPAGTVSGRVLLRFRLGDLTVHAWDLARAAGLDERLDDGLVDELWSQVAPVAADMAATGRYGTGPSGRLPETASTQARLLDAFGRRP